MNNFEIILITSIFILFPLFSYFLLIIYQQDNKEKNEALFFALGLYTMLYLIFKIDLVTMDLKLTLLTIPLFLAYLKKRPFAALIISILIFSSYSIYFNFNPLLGLSELVIYFISYLILTYYRVKDIKTINFLVIIKIIFLYFYLLNQSILTISSSSLLLLLMVYYFLLIFIYLLLKKGETMANLHITIQQLKKENQLRDSLFKITHEIKNPIAVCKGYLDMLDINNKSQLRRFIPIIKQEIERTLMLMNDFLNLTKLKVVKRTLDLSVLLEDVSDIGKELIKAHKMIFITEMEDTELYIKGDYNRLKQVFINLIKNAIEATEAVKKGVIKLKVQKRNKKISIFIIDNGEGMSKEVLKRVGEAFYSTKKNGTGLGVKLSREIIAEHHGIIKYESKLNKGTTVIIDLPLIKDTSI